MLGTKRCPDRPGPSIIFLVLDLESALLYRDGYESCDKFRSPQHRLLWHQSAQQGRTYVVPDELSAITLPEMVWRPFIALASPRRASHPSVKMSQPATFCLPALMTHGNQARLCSSDHSFRAGPAGTNSRERAFSEHVTGLKRGLFAAAMAD